MNPIIKKIVKYTITLGVSAFLVWWIFKDQDFNALKEGMQTANYWWVALSIVISIGTNILRAYRWNLLMEPLGFSLSTFRTYLALMVGYFSNLFVPRMGEVTRCGILTRTDKVPFAYSFGSVIAERFVDMFSLLIVICIALILEFDKLNSFISPLVQEKIDGMQGSYFLLYVLLIGLILLFIAWILYRVFENAIKRNPYFQKVVKLLGELWKGLLSIRQVKKQPQFWLATVLIWLSYFFMAYVVFFSFEATSDLTWLAGLSILVMGGIGMAAPVQGGIGVYHLLVSGVLVLYGIPKTDGLVFATVIHATQALAIVVIGAISFFISLLIESNRNNKSKA